MKICLMSLKGIYFNAISAAFGADIVVVRGDFGDYDAYFYIFIFLYFYFSIFIFIYCICIFFIIYDYYLSFIV